MMKWAALVMVVWMLFIAALLFYTNNATACKTLGGQYVFIDNHFQCQKELP